MQSEIPAAIMAVPAMTRPARTGDPSQSTPDQPGRADSDARPLDRADSDVRPPGQVDSDMRSVDGVVVEDADLVVTGVERVSESGGVFPAVGGDHERATRDASSRAAGEPRKPTATDVLKPALRQSVDREAAPVGDLTISAVDLVALLQNRRSRGWLYNHAGAVIAALVTAWTVAMLAFMQQGFTDLKTEIADVKTDLKTEIADVKTDLEADIAEVKTDLEADIADVKTDLEADIAEVKADIAEVKTEVAEVRGDIDELRSDVNDVDKRLSVLIGILNLRREIEDAIQGQINTPSSAT